MANAYKLVGFNRDNDLLEINYDIPPKHVLLAKKIAGIEGRPDIIGDWPLSDEQAKDIGNVIGQAIDTGRYEFTLEPYAPTTLRERARV